MGRMKRRNTAAAVSAKLPYRRANVLVSVLPRVPLFGLSFLFPPF